jgi:transposase
MLTLNTIPKLYIGIDVHKKSWRVHIKTDISDHKEYTMTPNADELFNYINKHSPTYQVHVAYEACCTGFSAARQFLSFGWNTTVVNTADIPRTDKSRYQKTDKIDSRLLCLHLRNNTLKPIHISTEQQDYLKSLIRHRNQVVKQLRTIKNQIKSLLLYHGIAIPELMDNPNWTKDFLLWIQRQSNQSNYITFKFTIDNKLTLYQSIYSAYLTTANTIRLYCRQHYKQDYYLLKSIPGIGGIVSGALIGELGDISRFNNETQFANYLGLVPGIRQSGEETKTTGVTPRCRSLLRSYLIEAAWVAIRKDPEIQTYYRKHFGKNTKTIIVKVAHKMCRRILSVIKNKKPYQISNAIIN